MQHGCARDGELCSKRSCSRRTSGLKWEKCRFEQLEVEYLGHEKKDQTITVESADFQQPTSVKEPRGFLGLTGYFRKFIQNYSAIASPLYEATSVKNKNGKPIIVEKRRSEKVNLELDEKLSSILFPSSLCVNSLFPFY